MANEVRLIDANAFIATIEKIASEDKTPFFHLDEITQEIFDAPTIDPESLRQVGRWKFLDIDGWWLDECSICGDTTPNHDGSPPSWNYCPNCGAKMEG